MTSNEVENKRFRRVDFPVDCEPNTATTLYEKPDSRRFHDER
jgi:hypothetical protein